MNTAFTWTAIVMLLLITIDNNHRIRCVEEKAVAQAEAASRGEFLKAPWSCEEGHQ